MSSLCKISRKNEINLFLLYLVWAIFSLTKIQRLKGENKNENKMQILTFENIENESLKFGPVRWHLKRGLSQN